MKTCKTAGCQAVPSGGLRWCDDCLVHWSTTGTLPTAAALTSTTPVVIPAPAVVDDVGPDGMHRCGNCTGWFRVLVDDALCLRCDGLLYPSAPVLRAAS